MRRKASWRRQKTDRLANEHNPELGIPLTGLGDVAMDQGRYQEAIKWYQAFLTFLTNEKQKGDPQNLTIYEEEYQAQYEQANMKLKILRDSMTSIVLREIITRGLKPISFKD